MSKRTAFELPIGLRAALPIAACLLLAAALSWARDILAGSLGLDTRSLPVGYRIWPFVAFGVLAAIAGRRFLQVLRSTPRYPWPHLLAGAFAIHLAALPALPLTSSDLFSHLSYARLSQLGKNPYRTGPADLPEGDGGPKPHVDVVVTLEGCGQLLDGPLADLGQGKGRPVVDLLPAVVVQRAQQGGRHGHLYRLATALGAALVSKRRPEGGR